MGRPGIGARKTRLRWLSAYRGLKTGIAPVSADRHQPRLINSHPRVPPRQSKPAASFVSSRPVYALLTTRWSLFPVCSSGALLDDGHGPREIILGRQERNALELYQAGRTRRVCTEANANESPASLALKRLPRTCTNESLSSGTLLRAPSRTRQLAFCFKSMVSFSFLASGPRKGIPVTGRAECSSKT